MTQRIFKKSCKQDMIELFEILPDWVNYVYEKEYEMIYCFAEKKEKVFHSTGWNIETYVLDIDFETDKVEEMIIERPMEE